MSIRNVPMLPNLCDFGEKAADMLRQHPAEIAALRAIFDPATHAHRPDCCGPNIGTDCIGCAMAEREEYAAEIERLRAQVKRLRDALVGIVADDDVNGLRFTAAVLESIDCDDATISLAAVRALIDIRPEGSAGEEKR